MRWSDEYTGLLGVVAAFAAVVLGVSGASSVLVAAVAVLAVGLLAAMLWSWRHTARVLVVGPARTEPVDLMQEALDDAGYGLVRCDGPSAHACPVYRNQPCPVHGRPVGAVIVRAFGEERPVPPCGRALHIPALPVEEGDRTPEEAVRNLESLLEVR